jgi:flagellar biosynthesis/type III secretory pathway protein FliH
MSRTLTVHLERPITSAGILDGYNSNAESSVTDSMNPAANVEQTRLTGDLKAQKPLYSEVCRTLQRLAAKLNQFYDEIFAGQKEEIAKLSVEIARKILMQKVQDGDYEIESIVQEALKNAPTHDSLVVHLNPEDLAACQKAQDDDAHGGTLGGIKLVADANIGRAECVLESGKGVIKSLIDEHLEQIEKALKKTE